MKKQNAGLLKQISVVRRIGSTNRSKSENWTEAAECCITASQSVSKLLLVFFFSIE